MSLDLIQTVGLDVSGPVRYGLNPNPYQRDQQQAYELGNIATPSDHKSAWKKGVRLARYFYNEETKVSPERAPTFNARTRDADEWGSSRWEYVSTSDILDSTTDQVSTPAEIEMAP
ncbi:hypothetical protein CJ030_MR2G018481 [Morella rubra]|uniref:Uncharacterized protein n=1 Tax=Morella rubra TaxID=262757 RepID=A0A6A1W9P7_9ROSI|nr:hypothetical protein CJ030_MR2G018481 [Morella rubra]